MFCYSKGFCSVYAGAWDAVVTCFFLDTASNVVEYIEVISKILKEGAVSTTNCCWLHSYLQCSQISKLIAWQVWINLGPLLYHFADVCSQDDVCLYYISICSNITFFYYISKWSYIMFCRLEILLCQLNLAWKTWKKLLFIMDFSWR